LVDQVLRELVPIAQIKRAIAVQFQERIPWGEARTWIEDGLEATKEAAWGHMLDRKVPAIMRDITDEVTAEIRTQLQATLRQP
jgi:hypothetical protein